MAAKLITRRQKGTAAADSMAPRCLNPKCRVALFWESGQWWHPNPARADCAESMAQFDWRQQALY